MRSYRLLTLVLVFLACTVRTTTYAFSTPTFGLGSLLFQPKGLATNPTKGNINTLLDASEFFVDAFWVGKVGGGTRTLNPSQRLNLERSQFLEFRFRYAGKSRGKAELIVCQLPNGQVVGCAGIEVTPIPGQGSLKAPPTLTAPLMSNLAVSRNYRRMGIAELLVAEVERVARYEWGYEDCYLYVEERNTAAVKLYEKLGYRKEWIDSDAKTLLPTENGSVTNVPTKIVCMKKRFGQPLWARLLPF
jgi:ribosomal protein S18 acetylase RimI-like enzyme